MEHTNSNNPSNLYGSDILTHHEYFVSTDAERGHLIELEKRTDIEASRMRRYLSMSDLSRNGASPLSAIVERVRNTSVLKNFDTITIPEVIPTDILFDLFDFAADHVARSPSDTYYVNKENVLRTHDTVMWHYYLNLPEIRERVAEQKPLGVVCYGKVFRKDEIDRKHMNIFHQFGGLYLQPDSLGTLPIDELKKILTEIVQSTFGNDVKYRFLEDTFPYTDPSLQIEVDVNTDPNKEPNWIEIMGGGMPKKSVLKKMGIEGYNGWAFGFGLERLAIISMELPDIRLLWSDDERVTRQFKLGQKFTEVSKYPAVVRDISFLVPKTFTPNNYFDLVRDVIGDVAEEVQLLDTYENIAKFGPDKVSYAYRITYRSLDRTLTNNEVDELHKKLENRTIEVFGATVR